MYISYMKLRLLLVALTGFLLSYASAQTEFHISFPASISDAPVTGRMFLVIARTDSVEPRLQVGRYGTQFFGVDFEKLQPAKEITVDGTILGYPVNDLKDIPPGEYYIQAVLNKYTEFKRSDGHTLWMHMAQWEGQDWRRSPGNLHSEVRKITIGGTSSGATGT